LAEKIFEDEMPEVVSKNFDSAEGVLEYLETNNAKKKSSSRT
jgi:hypothetical protein